MVNPDEEMKEFALLPPGKVPNMTVTHSHSHYNLVVSRHCRLVQSFLKEKSHINQETTEFLKLKEEHELLKVKHSECLKQIETLQKNMDELKGTKEAENNASNLNEDEEIEEIVLLNGKKSGFKREGPHSEPKAKPAAQQHNCKTCGKVFRSKGELGKHALEHTNDGDWTCDDCPHQTNTL